MRETRKDRSKRRRPARRGGQHEEEKAKKAAWALQERGFVFAGGWKRRMQRTSFGNLRWTFFFLNLARIPTLPCGPRTHFSHRVYVADQQSIQSPQTRRSMRDPPGDKSESWEITMPPGSEAVRIGRGRGSDSSSRTAYLSPKAVTTVPPLVIRCQRNT